MEDHNRIRPLEIKNGNEQAFRRLFDSYKNILYAYAFKFTRNRELSEEAVQEVFLKLWVHRASLDPERPLEGYLFRMARNQVFNMLKRAVYNERLKEYIFSRPAVYEHSAEEQLILSEIQEAKDQAISQLSPRRRLIFRMSRLEGLTHDEIAEKLGISKNTVKDQIVKANHLIREYLCEHAELTVPALILILSSLNSGS